MQEEQPSLLTHEKSPGSPNLMKMKILTMLRKAKDFLRMVTRRFLTTALGKKWKEWSESMIGSMEKGIEAAKLSRPPEGSYEGLDLKVLPKYICFKAALLKEKTTLQLVVLILAIFLLGHYAISKLEVVKLYQKLREKEYILAPGVMDFTTASPQSVPDSYISDAVSDFLSSLGNVNPNNIDEQYRSLARFMNQRLKIKFDMDTADWVQQVKTENISQILTITDKEIKSDEKGSYKIVALGRAEFYTNHQYLGYEDQVVEMILKLTPPESGKRWYLEIENLSWSKAKTFETKSHLESPIKSPANH